MFWKISFINWFNNNPIIFDSNLFHFSLILITPSSHSSFLLFCPCSCTCYIVLSSITHLNGSRNMISIYNFSISFNNSKFSILLFWWDDRQITTFDQTFVESIKKCQRYIFILFMRKMAIYPFSSIYFEILKCW